MSERYQKIYSLPERQYTQGSPVLLMAGVLLKDNQANRVVCQFKFRNISAKVISALIVTVRAFDITGKEIEGVIGHQLLDFDAGRNDEFGQKQAIPLPDKNARSMQMICTKVVFADGSTWSAPENARWEPLPKQIPLSQELGDLEAQYQRQTSTASSFVPTEYQDLWLCTCGNVNQKNESVCPNCQLEKKTVFGALNAEQLKTSKESLDAAVRSKKAKMTIISLLAVAAVAVVLLVTQVIIPKGKYNRAVALMDNAMYDEAIVAFQEVIGYKDAEQRIQDCEAGIIEQKYNAAVALMEDEQYDEAISAFEELDGYKDAEEQIEASRTGIEYKRALDLADNGQIEEAYVALQALDGYKDSAEVLDKIKPQYKQSLWNRAEIGSTVLFGAYEQDNDLANGSEDIEWFVLSKDSDRMLLLSKYGLDCVKYNETDEATSWEKCSLRTWMNSEFVSEAFSAKEREQIALADVVNEWAGEYDVQDHVFLLSVPEVENLLDDEQKACISTEYAINQGIRDVEDDGKTTWYTRSLVRNDRDKDEVFFINTQYVTIGDWGWFGVTRVDWGGPAIRPAIWVYLDQ